MAKSTIDVKFKAVIFNRERVKATLESRKTQFRRIDDKYQIGDILFVQETYSTIFDGESLGFYKESFTDAELEKRTPIKWIPSLFMPQKFARLFLEVVNVRKEKLQDITLEDCLKEGVESKETYRKSWDSKNKNKPGIAWSSNPKITVVEFKVIEVKK
jgi:hypothetical protein